MRPPRYPDPALRAQVIDRDGHVCQVCGKAVREDVPAAHPDRLTVDHVVQYAIGGSTTLSNLRVACADCNARRPKPITARTRFFRDCEKAHDQERADLIIDLAASRGELAPVALTARQARLGYRRPQ